MHRRKGRGVRIEQTFRMPEPAGALANSPRPVWRLTSAARAVRVRSDVEDDIVRVGGVRNALDAIEGVEPESVPNFPSDHMVGAGGIPADAEPADSDSVSIKRKSTAKHVHAADAVADHRISLRAEVLGAALALLETGLVESGLAVPIAIRDLGVNGIAVLQAVEAAARLHRREEIGCRQGEASAPNNACRRGAVFTQAEGIGRVRLLSRNNPAAQPLVDKPVARKGNGADRTVSSNQRPPHIKSKTAVAARSDDVDECCFEVLPTGQLRAICKCRAGKDRKERAGRNRKHPLLDVHRTSPLT